MIDHPQLHLAMTAKQERDSWWTWSVWIEGSDEELDRVKSVRYILHPTYTDPIRVIRDRGSKFRLNESGWGEFSITAFLAPREGEEFRLERWIDLPGCDQRRDRSIRKPRVFLSFSATDKPIAEKLRRDLARHKVDVISSGDLTTENADFSEVFENLRNADVVVIMTAHHLRGFAEREVSIAQRAGRPIIPVLLGSDSPPELAQFKSLRLDSSGQTQAVADALAARAKDEFHED